MSPSLPIVPTSIAPLAETRCRLLLSKGLYINAGLPPGQHVTGDGNFWCGKTQTIYGPDDQLCDAERCCHSQRSCFESLGGPSPGDNAQPPPRLA
jgi:hypothetical protein